MISLVRKGTLRTAIWRMTTTVATSRRINPSSSDNNATEVIDNPCWGSPTLFNLKDLIQKYPRETCILLETPDYLVLNKPPDLRMDGEFPATVQKLLTYWYPPASLVKEEQLLQTVSDMKYPLKDSELRHCHQLDYATSGVLLFARSRQAAAAAMKAFVSRQVHKVYLAMVHGHVQVNKDWPILPKERLQVLEQQETLYRQRKAKKRDDTFQGFLPPHSMFQKWKAYYLKQNKSDEKDSKRLKREEPVDLGALWKEAAGEQVMTTDELNQLANSSWKQVKRNDKWKHAMERLSNLYNDVQRKQNESKEKSESTLVDLPKLFRVEGEADNAFYIFAPLAEAKNDFAMRVKPGTLPKERRAFEGSSDLDYKPSLTRCVVLEHGVDRTKVQLEPKTGRRHQLRVHMLIADTAIVGDATYEVVEQSKSMHPRMCLHAHSLSLPVLNGQQLSVTAPDPFNFDE